MSEVIKNENGFIGYEYKDVTVRYSMEAIYTDGYTNFGWSLESTSVPIQSVGSLVMKFKRDRKIRNKAELSRLQRQFDSCVAEIEALERSKAIGASTAAYGVGIIGTAFMAGSVFAYIGNMLPLSIILAVPAFIGWIVPYFSYNLLFKKKSDKVSPLVDAKYDEIYEVCEKGNGLLKAQ